MSIENIDQYIEKQPEIVRLIFQNIRDAIKAVAPDAGEKINYGIPAISLVQGGKHDNQLMFAAYKQHGSGFCLFPSTIEHLKDELDSSRPLVNHAVVMRQTSAHIHD